jgi:cation-transporting ATPase E
MSDTLAQVDAERGLTETEVAERVASGKVNLVPNGPSRTVGQILWSNIFTRFNLLMCSLLAVVLVCRAWKDALFGGVVLLNALVGIVQELRAKATLDKLAVLSAPRAWIVRDGAISERGVSEIVLDDVIELRPGQQVVADAVVLTADALEIDESLLTGEADAIVKEPGDELMSGSFVVSGNGRAQVTKVGADAYAAKLAEEARRFTLSKSLLRAEIDRIVSWVGWALIPTGIVLFWSSTRNDHGSVRDAVVKATGGVVAMVPEGLILLTTVAFAVGVVRLARKRTLVQELPSIETLARVDVVCLDKTGTITSGEMTVAEVRAVGDAVAPEEINSALAAIAWSDPNPNATQLALQHHEAERPDWQRTAAVPFSSARKWSSTTFDGHGSWIIGAPEMVLDDDMLAPLQSDIETEAKAGRRVLVVAHAATELTAEQLPADRRAVALVMIEDVIRPDAPETLAYFAQQDVTLKVISGDNPVTVASVAERAGLAGADSFLDARKLPADQAELADVLERTTVFGRVSPHQKQAMVAALQSRGHTVAMTGDGVNDVLALKDADVGIAMASGSEATRAVAQLVLLDSNFSGLPAVVNEGRRVINNLQRVASLFLTKTTYAVLLAIVCGVSGIVYPFHPRHLTLVGTLTIGVPSFFLALAPSTDRVRGDFLKRVARVAVPSGVIAATATMAIYIWARHQKDYLGPREQTCAVLVLAAVGLLVLLRTARPYQPWKVALVSACALSVLAAVVTRPGQRFFELHLPPTGGLIMIGAVIAAAAAALIGADVIVRRWLPEE